MARNDSDQTPAGQQGGGPVQAEQTDDLDGKGLEELRKIADDTEGVSYDTATTEDQLRAEIRRVRAQA